MVVIDKNTAVKYFGDWKNAMEKTIKMDNLLSLKVAGVIDNAPANSNFPLKIFVSYITWKQHPAQYGYENDWEAISSSHQVFMLLPPDDAVSKIDKQLKNFSSKHFDNKGPAKRFEFLQPLSSLHFDTRFVNTLADHITKMATLRTLSFIGILIIIMASINFINLSTAQSVGRSKEVGIRKVLGSSRAQLFIQIMGETTVIVNVAAIIGLFMAKLTLPLLGNIAGVPASVNLLSAGSLLCLVCINLTVIILSGLYPALIVSAFKPVLALKNKITAASVGGIPLRRALVVAQFAISQLLIMGTIVAVNQMDFVNNTDLGFNKNAVLIIPGSNDQNSLLKMPAFKQQLLQNPAVKSVSLMSDAPSSDNNLGTNFYFNHTVNDPGFIAFLKFGDDGYFKTFQLHFAAGKGYDLSDTMRQAVVNQTLLRKLGIRDDETAIGKTIRLEGNRWSTITGVITDFKTNSLREIVRPIIMFPAKSLESQIAIKITTKNLPETIASIRGLWEKTYPEYAYNGFFLDDSIAQFYKQENQLALIYKIFSLIAIFISCLGLYGLISFMVVKRTKEVGIRKVLGASVSSIVMLFSKEFIILIIISSLIAIPAAWYLMTGWLQTFAFHITLSAWIFLSTIALSVLIAWLTGGYKATRAALVNPVKSLRSE